jgi:hypothetical protein
MVSFKMPPEREITREQLLALLREAGARVSSAQLHRWTDAGVLPRPRRRGLGRGGGKGTTSLYPALAFPQALALHTALRLQRNLDDAAWTVWLFGFPLTGYVRELLLEEWREDERSLREMVRLHSGKRGRVAIDRAIRRARRAELGPLAGILPNHVMTVYRMFAEMQYGELRPGVYTADDWERFRDAVSAEAPPGIIDENEPVALIEADAVSASRHMPLRSLIAALKRASDDELCMCRNELQELQRIAAQSVAQATGPITRVAFRAYFGQRLVDPNTAAVVIQLFQALGWTRPPASPLERLAATLQPEDNG